MHIRGLQWDMTDFHHHRPLPKHTTHSNRTVAPCAEIGRARTIKAVTSIGKMTNPTERIFGVLFAADVDEVQVFAGNLTVSDHFHQLYVEGDSLLLTARYV